MLQKSYTDNLPKDSKHLHKSDPHSYPVVGAILQLAYFIIGAGAVPVRLLLRKNFGERTIPPLALFISLVFHTYYVFEHISVFNLLGLFLQNLFGKENLNSINNWDGIRLALLFGVFVINFYGYYLYQVFYKRGRRHFKALINAARNNQVKISSYYRGDGQYFRERMGTVIKTPLGRLTVDEDIQRMVVEPWEVTKIALKILLVSIVLTTVFVLVPFTLLTQILCVLAQSLGATAIMIMLSAICLFLEELGIFLRIRGTALDILDGEEDLQVILAQKSQLLNEVAEKDPSKARSNLPGEAFPEIKL